MCNHSVTFSRECPFFSSLHLRNKKAPELGDEVSQWDGESLVLGWYVPALTLLGRLQQVSNSSEPPSPEVMTPSFQDHRKDRPRRTDLAQHHGWQRPSLCTCRTCVHAYVSTCTQTQSAVKELPLSSLLPPSLTSFSAAGKVTWPQRERCCVKESPFPLSGVRAVV